MREGKRHRPQTKTADSTIEAMMWALRWGLSALTDPWLKKRFEMCDRAAIEEIKSRLLDMRARSNGVRPNWPSEDVDKVMKAWEAAQNAQAVR